MRGKQNYERYWAYILNVSRPAAGEQDGSSCAVQCLAHVGVASLVDLWRGIAAIKLEAVHTPLCKCVGIFLDIALCSRVTTTRASANICT